MEIGSVTVYNQACYWCWTSEENVEGGDRVGFHERSLWSKTKKQTQDKTLVWQQVLASESPYFSFLLQSHIIIIQKQLHTISQSI